MDIENILTRLKNEGQITDFFYEGETIYLDFPNGRQLKLYTDTVVASDTASDIYGELIN